MLVARRYVLCGRVQGVGFRFFVDEVAAVEGLAGWVRNLEDGRVEVLAQGDRDAVDRFERRIRRGPPAARVEGVETHEEGAVDHLSGFRIKS
jgi:acylphosphatase